MSDYDSSSSSILSSLRQASDASAQAAQQMREQFRAAVVDVDAGIRQQLANELRARQQQGAEIQRMTAATVRDQTQQWNGVFTGMNRGFANTVTAMSNSTRSFQQAIGRVLEQILADFLRMLERMVAQWVAQHVHAAVRHRVA